MTGLLRRIHTAIYAYFVRHFRIRKTLAAFKQAHSQELTQTPVYQWPLLLARHQGEITAVRQGILDARALSSDTQRKSWQWPMIPASVQRLSVPLLKQTAYNLRRFSRTPVPRRAINLIKGAIITQPWDIVAIDDAIIPDSTEEQDERRRIAKRCFDHPNGQDSFQSWMEMGLEDMCVYGAFVAELAITPDPERPFKAWCMDVATVRIFAAYSEATPDMPHYAQMTGLKGERGTQIFYDDELLYIKDNPATDTPFGIGKLEVCFSSVNDFLGVQSMAGRAGADQVHKTFMWWEQPQNEASYQIVRRHIQNELEGQAKLSIIGGMKKPEIIEVTPVTEADLLLNWQELLIRMIANGFDMSAMALGVEHDINRAVGEVLDDKDFRSAPVPMAKRVEENFTRRILHDKLHWYDLKFKFLNLDDPDVQTRIDMFGRLYQMNAITPNLILKGMNREPLGSPYADLTQFECMLLNIEAMGLQQEQMQQKQADRQEKMQDKQYDQQQEQMQQQQDQYNQENGIPGADGMAGAGGRKAPAFPKLSLPKFPIMGAKYTARQLATMPAHKVEDVFYTSGLTADQFVQQMDEQEPGILSHLTEEVKLFLDDRLKEEQKKKRRKAVKPALLKRWEKELKTRLREEGKRTDDFSVWLWKKGQRYAKPGGGSSPQSKAGKPGLPPQRF